MPLVYWLNLIGVVSLLSLLGLFINSMERGVPNDTSCQVSSNGDDSLPHPFLCEQKINIHNADIADIASIDGIAKPLAQEIYQFLKKNPSAKIATLAAIKGVGPKTIERLQMFFVDK